VDLVSQLAKNIFATLEPPYFFPADLVDMEEGPQTANRIKQLKAYNEDV